MTLNFPELEEKILKFWREKKIFEKLRAKNRGKKRWSFLDGPITANNPMGVHHAWGRTYKDLFQRYKAMNGFDERFQNGFDCQGLWVEVEVEKELGFHSKKDIEKYGIEKFVNKCKERVAKYSKIQTEQSIQLGQWMDWENSYYTMSDENNYAIWSFLKKCKAKGILYKGRDVVPWCPRCGTAISQHEILNEEYKEISHRAVFLKLPVISSENTFFLAWTTTPWTLPANVALAVHPDLEYAKVKSKNGEIFILLKGKANLIPDAEIISVFKGKELEGMNYFGLFDELAKVKETLKNYKHRVVLWDEVVSDEGTGIVHIAPGCGQEDFQLSKKIGLPVINPTGGESRYREGFGEFSGKFVFKEEARDFIIEKLNAKKLIFKVEDYKHRYPTCWRCKTELIFRLVDEWYISMEKLRGELMESVNKVKWFPPFGRERELDWLKNMQDWLISKKRYWGLALPIYECKKCGNFEVIGSKEELKQRAIGGWDDFEGHSPHRPWIDNVKIKCSKCGETISRISDVGTPWLDAGIVPFSTLKYFSDKNYWEKWFPVDFICESFPGQFKNWFYALLVMSQVLENTSPTKMIFGFATVVDEKGEEMHKSKGNAIWFGEARDKMGADVIRWMCARQNPVYNLKFGWQIAKEMKRKLLTLWNSFIFFETYGIKQLEKGKLNESQNLLDKWIISKRNRLIKTVSGRLDKYDSAKAILAIEDFFIDDLSLWYIRRSRKKFQNPDNTEEKEKASAVLRFVLLTLTKLIAPIMPFLAEELYLKLKAGESMPESVHLNDWPLADENKIDDGLEQKMETVRKIVALALSLRAELGLKVRQPLAELRIKGLPEQAGLKGEKELLELIKEEVNVKKITFDPEIEKEIQLDTKITEELKEEGDLREFIRSVQQLRKKQRLTPKDKILIYYKSEGNLKELLEKNKEIVLRETRANDLAPADIEEGIEIKKA